jgi:hypothetical protein
MSRVMAALTAVMLGSLPVARLYAADMDPDPLASGPKALVITSSVAPAQRPRLRKIIATAGVRQFQRWQAQGVLDSYQLFFNRNVETDGWDLITLVTFARYSDVARWNDLEKTHPAGLPIEAAQLLREVHTSAVDLMAKVRARLRESNPEWKAASEHKQDIRHEHAIVLTEQILPE